MYGSRFSLSTSHSRNREIGMLLSVKRRSNEIGEIALQTVFPFRSRCWTDSRRGTRRPGCSSASDAVADRRCRSRLRSEDEALRSICRTRRRRAARRCCASDSAAATPRSPRRARRAIRPVPCCAAAGAPTGCTVDDVLSARAPILDDVAKMRMQLRRAAGEIDRMRRRSDRARAGRPRSCRDSSSRRCGRAPHRRGSDGRSCCRACRG